MSKFATKKLFCTNDNLQKIKSTIFSNEPTGEIRTSFQRSCGLNLKDNIHFCLLQISAVIRGRGDFMQNQLKTVTLSLVNVKSTATATILFQWVLLHQVIRQYHFFKFMTAFNLFRTNSNSTFQLCYEIVKFSEP